MTQSLAALALAALALAAPAPHPAPPPPGLHQAKAHMTPVAAQLEAYVAFCDRTARPEYRADCLSERFNLAADTLGRYGQTAALYRALKRAARDLNRVSRRYASPDMPPLTLSSPDFTTTRPIQPVAPGNLGPANAAAEAVLAEAELTLLRSADRAPDILAFQQVAEILGSAKVLLRAG